jgi:hypothetical protein
MGKVPGRSLIATLSLATLASLVAVLLHGLVDDALYGNRGTPLLLLVPGMAVLCIGQQNQPNHKWETHRNEARLAMLYCSDWRYWLGCYC